MNELLYRYNRFTQSYLINYQNYEFETDPELFTIIQTYYDTNNSMLTLKKLQAKNIHLSQDDLHGIIKMIEEEKDDKESFLRARTYKIVDFKIFNKLLDHRILIWLLFLSLFLFTFAHVQLFVHYLVLPRSDVYAFTNIIMIVPIYFLSRLLFTPVHEFGHNFFYYIFTGKSAKFYIQFPGFLYFMGISTTDDLFYITNPIKRIIISLGGILFETMFLILLLVLLQNSVNSFFLQILSLRVLLSVLFNLNFLSQSTDGHILLTDLLGFTTFTETYNEFLKGLINRKFIPAVPVTRRVSILLLTYTVFGLVFIGLLVVSQFIFFKNIAMILILPLTNNFFGMKLGVLEIFLIILTYLYYIDILVRMYEKRIIVQKALKFRSE